MATLVSEREGMEGGRATCNKQLIHSPVTNNFTHLCELCELAQLSSTQPCHLTQLGELPELVLASAV